MILHLKCLLVKESPTASVSSKLEDPVAIEDPKIVSLLSSIYDEVRKQPEENILNKEEIIRNQDTTTDTIEKDKHYTSRFA